MLNTKPTSRRFGWIARTLAPAVACLLCPSLVPAPNEGAAAWYSVATIDRVQKPNRVATRPLPKRQRAPLMTVQWHLLKRLNGGKSIEADPSVSLETDDQIKLVITANQNGYLYLINQPEGKDGVVLFPDLRISGGKNYVLKNQEYVVPSYCSDFADPKDCWFQMRPPGGKETLVLIFSRQQITTLPNQVAKAFGVVKRSAIEELVANTGQKVEKKTGELSIPGGHSAKYATRVRNTNPADNEELITTIEINHGEKPSVGGA